MDLFSNRTQRPRTMEKKQTNKTKTNGDETEFMQHSSRFALLSSLCILIRVTWTWTCSTCSALANRRLCFFYFVGLCFDECCQLSAVVQGGVKVDRECTNDSCYGNGSESDWLNSFGRQWSEKEKSNIRGNVSKWCVIDRHDSTKSTTMCVCLLHRFFFHTLMTVARVAMLKLVRNVVAIQSTTRVPWFRSRQQTTGANLEPPGLGTLSW